MQHTKHTLMALCQNKRQNNFLNLSKCSLEDRDVSILLDFIELHKIRHLDISQNQITSLGAESLATSEHLCIVNIGFNCIGSKGAMAFANSPHLRILLAASNSIGPEGIEALSKTKVLHTLDIRFNKLDVKLLRLFYNNTSLTQLMVYEHPVPKEHLAWVEELMARNLATQCQPLVLEQVKTTVVCNLILSYVHSPMLFFNQAASSSTPPALSGCMNHNLT